MVDPNRAGPSTLVRAGEQTFLVDCGRGVLMRAAAVGVGAADVTALLLTHLHSDHITDLVRRHHHPVGHHVHPHAAAGDRSARHRRGRRGHPRRARARHQLPHRPTTPTSPNRPSSRCEEVHRRAWCGVADGVRIIGWRRPTTARSSRRSPSAIEFDGASVVLAGDTVPCAEPRRARRGCGRAGAHRDSQGSRGAGAPAAPPGHPRLPLLGRAGRSHRRPRRRRHAGPHPLRARRWRPARRTQWRALAATEFDGRSNSATTCTASRCTRVAGYASRVISTTTSRSVDPSPE